MKHLSCYIDIFRIVKTQIKRFYPWRTSPPPILIVNLQRRSNAWRQRRLTLRCVQTFERRWNEPYAHLFCAVNNFILLLAYVILLTPREIVKYQNHHYFLEAVWSQIKRNNIFRPTYMYLKMCWHASVKTRIFWSFYSQQTSLIYTLLKKCHILFVIIIIKC